MKEMPLRALSGAVYVAILIAGLTLFEPIGAILLGLMLLVLSWPEAIGLFNLSTKDQLKAILMLAATLATAYLPTGSHDIPLLLALIIGPMYLLFSKDLQVQQRPLYLLLWMAPVVFSWTHSLHHDSGPLFMLAVFALIWVNDTFAYLGGRLLGKHKLWEALSPKKTWEGFLSGLAVSVLAALFFPHLFPGIFPAVFWPVVAVVVSVFSTFGDLLESKIKRQAGVKDSGTLIPGHGGILDRVDSFMMAWPAAYLCYLIYLNTGP